MAAFLVNRCVWGLSALSPLTLTNFTVGVHDRRKLQYTTLNLIFGSLLVLYILYSAEYTELLTFLN